MTSPSLPTSAAADPWDWTPPALSRWSRPVGLLRLDGPDTLRVLHGQTSQALEAARPGQWLGTCCIGPTARLRAVAEVLVDADGAWLVIVNGDPEAVRLGLDRVLFPADKVRLGPVTPATLHQPLGSAGPDAAPAGTWEALEGSPGWRLGDALLLPDEAPCPPWLAERRPLEPQEAERWRLQEGLPAAPGEINEDTNPFELGLAARVSLTKGCYVGQETLAKLATYVGVKQQLRRWQATSFPDEAVLPEAVAAGTPLHDAAGGRAGLISSSLQLPGGQGWIGLALVRRAWLQEPELQTGADPGVRLQLSIPAAFQTPPVGAGGGSGGAGAS
ncbi:MULTISPECIES: folate-binding protein YgfZ [unclassified Cyanobium]|uniref:CAF17-like 4Fe-4S cluster assembly/insertion protein YgfZ n=1 Tax=unclassified Cyanobium TaxID=2627006 RepID=UPI0020CCD946|nr:MULTISPECIES: folate-binding protein [unclassified Cyanobium]MCP9834093.1 folate-binding protein [Cyanobium sp. La Preciosa 7G6]MCP9936856.1 folate-binding protein [Cyanobium sp. Aljojuca 7A6]